MVRTVERLAGSLVLGGALALILAAPAGVLAADPAGSPIASASSGAAPSDSAPSPSPDGTISADPTFILDPTFVTEPTAPASGAVLGATGRPARTLPPTDSASRSAADGGAQGVPLLLGLLAATSLIAARLPTVRRR